MRTSKIEWTERTWNPVTGCSKVSEGCRNCYAEVMTRRLKAMGKSKYANGFTVTTHPDTLCEPYKWKPSTIFVCSMADLFHVDVPFCFIDKVMDIIWRTPQHTYQILTKRAERMADYFSSKLVPLNVWCGVTVEQASELWRVDYLTNIGSVVRFVSCEPLLGDLGKVNFGSTVDWVIVGGESGSNARPMKAEWVYNIWRHCVEGHVPFFFKQWGTYGQDGIKRSKKANGKELDGRTVQQMPQTWASKELI